ncbi:3-deoxy-7-phosphoheptulonate synthase [Candidatus Uhrbacteria bacterium]|nr:3-deoxy-7-phosphoheptulonate synthase [Candidatus Uhrbacteria bacterium]
MKDISETDLQNNLPLSNVQGSKRPVIVGNTQVGGETLTIMAGPCTVESREQVFAIAKAVKDAGATILRGGVFKPLTFPYGDPLLLADAGSDGEDLPRTHILSKKEVLERAESRFVYFAEAGKSVGLPIVSEPTFADAIDLMEPYVDMYQVGYRSMFNMDLLYRLCHTSKPVLLKRHAGESIRSLLGVVEHFYARGKTNIVVCERGVAVPHTHNTASRAILDIQAIVALNEYAPTIPVIADPSHSTFKRSYVCAMSRAAIAGGADGLLIDVHPTPEVAWVDPLQALNFEAFNTLMKDVRSIAPAVGRTL